MIPHFPWTSEPVWNKIYFPPLNFIYSKPQNVLLLRHNHNNRYVSHDNTNTNLWPHCSKHWFFPAADRCRRGRCRLGQYRAHQRLLPRTKTMTVNSLELTEHLIISSYRTAPARLFVLNRTSRNLSKARIGTGSQGFFSIFEFLYIHIIIINIQNSSMKKVE